MAIQRSVIDMSGRGGLSNKWFGDANRFGYVGSLETGDPNLRYLTTEGQVVNGLFNPVTRYGYNSPVSNTFLSTTIGGGGTAIAKTIPINLVDGGSFDMWFCCNNSHIYFADQFYNSTVTDAVTVSTALTTLVSFTDAAYYQLNGNAKIFFAWVGSSNGYISTISPGDSTGATFNEDWSSVDTVNPLVFSGGTQTLRMVPSGDGFMYILDRNKVHRLDGSSLGGTQGTLYQNVLVGQASTQIRMGTEYRNKLYLVIRNVNEVDHYDTVKGYASLTSSTNDFVGIYVWNKQSSFYNSSDFIQLPGVNDVRAIWVSPKGDLRIITVEASGDCALRIFDGTNFKVVKYLPFGAQPPTIKSVKNHGSFTYWLGIDGYIYGFGSDIPSEAEFLFIAGQVITDGQGTMVGGSLAIGSTVAGDAPPSNYKPVDVMWVGYATATNNGFLKTFYPFAFDTIATSNNIARHQGDIFYPVKILPSLSTVKHVNIIMARIEDLATPTQVEAIVKFYFNQSKTASFSKSITRADISKGYISIEINKPYVNSIQMEVEHNTNSNIGVADFAPAYAELIFDTTTTIK